MEGFKIGSFTSYILLGDDIVINHDGVSKRYITLMRRLGVDISLNKTHVSKDTWEFAKRWISKGVEITGLPIGGIIRNSNNPKVVMTIFYDYLNKLNIGASVIDLVSSYYNGLYLNNLGKLTYQRCFDYLFDYNKAMRFRLGLITSDELRSYIAGKNPKMELNCDLILLVKESLFGSFGKGFAKSLHKTVNQKINSSVNKLMGSYG